MPIVIQSVSIEKFLTWLDEQITAQFLFLLSPARFCFSRSSRGSRGSRGSFGYLSKRVYTTLNLNPEGLSLKNSPKSIFKWTKTKNIRDASKALKTMFDSLLDSDPLKLYNVVSKRKTLSWLFRKILW